jgi:hypothetical protein
MALWLSLAKGPVAIFALGILVLGLGRSVLLLTWDLWFARKHATVVRANFLEALFPPGEDGLPALSIKTSLKWVYFFASLCFPIGVLVCALFLRNHLSILDSLFGFAWPALPRPILDWTALAVILAGSFIILFRLYTRRGRASNNWRNAILLLSLLYLFTSGYLAGQDWNPLPYNGLMLFHTLVGLATLIQVPFSHYPLTLLSLVDRPARLPALQQDDGGVQALFHAEE